MNKLHESYWSWMIFLVILLHLCWGTFMLTIPLDKQDVSGGVAWNIFVIYGGLTFWGVVMIIGACLSLIGMYRGYYKYSYMLLMIQQAVSIIGAIGGVVSILGYYEDFELSRALRSGISWILICFCHSGAVYAYISKSIKDHYHVKT